MSEHLIPTCPGDRGFQWMPAIRDTSGDESVRVIESSAAGHPCIWLRVGPSTEASVHLAAEQAWQLAEQIEWLVERHHQGDARPWLLPGRGLRERGE